MRGVLATVLTASAVLLASTSAAAASRCERPAGAIAVQVTPASVVYARDGRTWWSCYRPSGRRTVIYRGGDTEAGSKQASDFRVAGAYVVFMATESIRSLATRALVLVDARRGKRVADVGIPNSDEPIVFTLRQLALGESGVLVWMETRSSRVAAEPRNDTLRVLDATGARTLDTGPIGSLGITRVTASTVHWRRNRVAASAAVTSRAAYAVVPFQVPVSKGAVRASKTAQAEVRLPPGFGRARTVNGSTSSYDFHKPVPLGDGTGCIVTLRGVARLMGTVPTIADRTASGRIGALRWVVGRMGAAPAAIGYRRASRGRWVVFELRLENTSQTPLCQPAVEDAASGLVGAIRSMRLVARR